MKREILFVSQELVMWGHCKTFEVISDKCNANTIWPSILHPLQTYNKIIPHFLIFHIHFAFKTLTEVHGQLTASVAMVQFIHCVVGTRVQSTDYNAYTNNPRVSFIVTHSFFHSSSRCSNGCYYQCSAHVSH